MYDAGLTTMRLSLRAMCQRGRMRFDPPGCLHCGAEAEGAICSTCHDLLRRLEARLPAPVPADALPTVPRGGFARFVSTDPRFVRRSDAGGRDPDKLPFEDEE